MYASEIVVWPTYHWSDVEDFDRCLVACETDEELRRICKRGERGLPPALLLAFVPGVRVYDPFQSEPALFLMFARLEPTEAAIMEFACRWGNLRGPLAGVPLLDWQNNIASMRQVVDVWESQTETDWDSLVALLGADFPGYSPRSGTKLNTTDQIGHPLERIAACVADRNEARFNLWRPSLRLTVRNGVGQLEVMLDALESVLWVQFLLAVTESRQFRKCRLCSKPFLLSPQANRADRQFCSDNCRVKHFQRRKRAAQRMRAGGASLRDIAAQLETDIATVKRWLKIKR